jgi:hypothetical protein
MDYHVECVEFDSDLAEGFGVEPGTYYTTDGGDTYMSEEEFRGWLDSVKKGLTLEDLGWSEGGGLNISGAAYADFSDEPDEDEEEHDASMVRLLPYKHSPEEGTEEANAQPWTIHIPLGSGPTDGSDDDDEDDKDDE